MATEYVALDLETTGLNRDTDAIIEIGAVRFSREGVLDTFETLVNPRRPLGLAVQALTGITDEELRQAPPLEAVAADFENFLGDAVLVGHNALDFDAVFLDRAGIRHSGTVYDTQELAGLLLPGLTEYGLAALAAHCGIEFPVRHRAPADAEASRALFLALQEAAARLPREVLGQIAQWLTPTAWPWRGFFAEVWALAPGMEAGAAPLSVRRPPAAARPLSPAATPVAVAPEEPLRVLASARGRADLFEEFDDRAVQQEMVRAVTGALNDGRRLLVEAGTGTGKSLAYLAPAACHALANETRVVISTATINLQEQLVRKDIPTLQQLLPARPELRACQLKGRRNYLCLRRFQAFRGSDSLSDGEALLASRVLVWLQGTETGDRAELRLSPAEEPAWQRLSAEGADCTSGNSAFVVDGSCFLQKARRQADSAHLVVVNHSLLLSDIAAGGHVLPPYEHLVIDEAHHLEDEASRQFGFRTGERDLGGLLDRCEAAAPAVQSGLRGMTLVPAAGSQLLERARSVRQAASAARPRLKEFCERLKSFLSEHAANGGDSEKRLRLSHGMRVQPDWTDGEIAWENLRLALGDTASRLEALDGALGQSGDLGIVNLELIQSDVRNLMAEVQEAVAGIAHGLEEDDPQRVVWLECERADGALVLAWVPLAVDELLGEMLYAGRRSIVLTGATLRSQGSFQYMQERLGLQDADVLELGSPFDYPRAALVLVPSDMPEPDSPHYLDALGRAVIELTRASQGRALVLFTSYAGLRAVHRMVSAPLTEEGIAVLGQGIDGSPRQLVRALKASPNTVLLGTASFWEGVDIPGEALSLLVMARLPFAVPTDPVFAARSELYEDAFGQFALPQAVLRFKQGFGRLIRTKTDRGVMVVLDRRIVSKSYGPDFLNSLPPCTRREAALREMPDLVERWLAARTPVGNPSS
ncbi:MAG: helicase C-terminal domain-containing protein [Dehalococcoidia bacterium]|nr:helicase C-terminal domain-containing protein [Dehalococcoidia bacterium]